MIQRKLFNIIISLSLVGVLLALYLLWQQFFHPVFRPCNVNNFVNCDAVISGPVAKTFGIPTPLIGLVGYIVIMLAAFMRNKRVLLYVTAFGLSFCLYLAYVELIQLRVICPVCIACQLIMTTVFTLSVILIKQKHIR